MAALPEGTRATRPRAWSALGRRVLGPIGRRGLRVSLVVGTILTAINEGPTVAVGHAEPSLIPRALLNYVVPFCVSCYSSAAAERSRRAGITANGAVPASPEPPQAGAVDEAPRPVDGSVVHVP